MINDTYKAVCDSNITVAEIGKALHSTKKGRAPGIDGLSVEFYVHFWEYIQDPLICMYKECVEQKEMTNTRQGIISLFPKPGKDAHCIDNWRPISLLTIDYKILALVYANRLKTGLGDIISETQSGFMKKSSYKQYKTARLC